MEKISWTDHVRNEEVLFRAKEQTKMRKYLIILRKFITGYYPLSMLYSSYHGSGILYICMAGWVETVALASAPYRCERV
jgi:hypothetical protein